MRTPYHNRQNVNMTLSGNILVHVTESSDIETYNFVTVQRLFILKLLAVTLIKFVPLHNKNLALLDERPQTQCRHHGSINKRASLLSASIKRPVMFIAHFYCVWSFIPEVHPFAICNDAKRNHPPQIQAVSFLRLF